MNAYEKSASSFYVYRPPTPPNSANHRQKILLESMLDAKTALKQLASFVDRVQIQTRTFLSITEAFHQYRLKRKAQDLVDRFVVIEGLYGDSIYYNDGGMVKEDIKALGEIRASAVDLQVKYEFLNHSGEVDLHRQDSFVSALSPQRSYSQYPHSSGRMDSPPFGILSQSYHSQSPNFASDDSPLLNGSIGTLSPQSNHSLRSPHFTNFINSPSINHQSPHFTSVIYSPPSDHLMVDQTQTCFMCKKYLQTGEDSMNMPCGHRCCRDCVQIYARTVTNETRPNGMLHCCLIPIPTLLFKPFISPHRYHALCLWVEEARTPMEDRIYCPSPTCGQFVCAMKVTARAAVIEGFVVCPNKACRMLICGRCKRGAHPGIC